MRVYPPSYIRREQLMLTEYRLSVKAVLEPGNPPFVFHWTAKQPLDVCLDGFQGGWYDRMRAQIRSLASVAWCKILRQRRTLGMHAAINHGEVDRLMAFRARPEQDEASPL
jgi:hypothetical protein